VVKAKNAVRPLYMPHCEGRGCTFKRRVGWSG
jgi:hypothetical protein